MMLILRWHFLTTAAGLIKEIVEIYENYKGDCHLVTSTFQRLMNLIQRAQALLCSILEFETNGYRNVVRYDHPLDIYKQQEEKNIQQCILRLRLSQQ
jgi:hypothetical protein